MRPKRHSINAFTIVELLLAATISALLFVALGTFVQTSLSSTKVIQDQNLATHATLAALDTLQRELLVAKQITTAGATQLAFVTTDITGDGADDAISYTWNSAAGTITRTSNGSAETFASGVANFALNYEYRTRTEQVILSGGASLPQVTAQFNGVSGPGYVTTLPQVSINGLSYAYQYFNCLVETPQVSSFTIRVRNAGIMTTRMQIQLDDFSSVLAVGYIAAADLHSGWRDVTIPLVWLAGTSKKMELGKRHRITIRPESSFLFGYAGHIQFLRIDSGPPLTNGLEFSVGGTSYGSTASAFFTVSSALPVNSPQRGTVSTQVLKVVTVQMRVEENGEIYEITRTIRTPNT